MDDDFGSYCIVLRDRRSTEKHPVKPLVKVNDLDLIREDSDDSIIFEEFVRQARAHVAEHPLDSPENYDIYVGFWGQWSLDIPPSFFAFVNETGLKVTLDIDD